MIKFSTRILELFICNFSQCAVGDQKNAHLWTLENASDNLKLFRAELLDYRSILTAVEGCSGVFHVASPVPPSFPIQEVRFNNIL